MPTSQAPRFLLKALACLLPALSGCAAGPYEKAELEAIPSGFAIVPTPAEGALRGYPAYGTPISIPGQATEIIPYVRTEREWWFRDSDAFDEGGLSNLSSGHSRGDLPAAVPVRWHNAVVRVQETGEQWPLLNFRGVISHVWIPAEVPAQYQGDEPPAPRALLFAVTFQDTNGDGLLDDCDGAQLLMTDANGRNPRVVTPSGTHLDRVTEGGPKGAVVVHLREDRNGDGLFESQEIPVPYLLRLGGEDVAERFINADIDSAIEALLEG